MARSNPSFMNGVPELLILRLLQEREMYGYELVQAIRAETDNVISLGEGVVYPALHALEKQRALKGAQGPHPTPYRCGNEYRSVSSQIF